MQVGLFEVPKIPRLIKILSSNKGLKEIFGCHHMKYLVFDNDIILTGLILNYYNAYKFF